MKTIPALKKLIVIYMSLLAILLLCVIATPLLIRNGTSITITLIRTFMIEEETLESILIVILFAVSYLIWRGFAKTVTLYQRAADQAGEEKSIMVSRLAEAFNYIGTVNVGLQEIQNIFSSPDGLPQSKRELKRILDRLAAKALAIAGAQWVVIRVIDRSTGRTIKEHAFEKGQGIVPTVTMGNRALIEGRQVKEMRAIGSRRKNLDLMTVCIFPAITISEQKVALITAIAHQIEMVILLYRATSFQQRGMFHQIQKGELY